MWKRLSHDVLCGLREKRPGDLSGRKDRDRPFRRGKDAIISFRGPWVRRKLANKAAAQEENVFIAVSILRPRSGSLRLRPAFSGSAHPRNTGTKTSYIFGWESPQDRGPQLLKNNSTPYASGHYESKIRRTPTYRRRACVPAVHPGRAAAGPHPSVFV